MLCLITDLAVYLNVRFRLSWRPFQKEFEGILDAFQQHKKGDLLRTDLFQQELSLFLLNAVGTQDYAFVEELLGCGFSFTPIEKRRAISSAANVDDAQMLDLLLQSQSQAMINSSLSECRDILLMASCKGHFDFIEMLQEKELPFTNYQISGAMDAAMDTNDIRILDLFLKTQNAITRIRFCARNPDILATLTRKRDFPSIKRPSGNRLQIHAFQCIRSNLCCFRWS